MSLFIILKRKEREKGRRKKDRKERKKKKKARTMRVKEGRQVSKQKVREFSFWWDRFLSIC